ncbi:hypothetical protein B7494_g82 [Chlorociboria aeruginascens]|nr:hypothetical protein B7494_g82 [Chlorociboria aeruginascens]
MGEAYLSESSSYEPVAFGTEMRDQFLFAPDWKNLNHGSFGAVPRAIRDKQREYQDLCEQAPDRWIRYIYPKLLDESREAIAKLLNVSTSTIVLVPNATTAVNTVLLNLVWNKDGNDEIIYFNTIYGACGKVADYICEANHNIVSTREILLNYPLEDGDLLASFRDAIQNSKLAGKTPRIAIFDTVTSMPGVRMPFGDLITICREEGVLSMVDGAHGIGHIPLDLSTLSPDFFVSNCHKWLLVPRGCAVFYVPEKHQPLIRSTMPTSHGFVTKRDVEFANPFPPKSKSEFENNFEFVGTIDNTNYLVAAEVIKWRKEVCGGEEAIMKYSIDLAKEGGKLVAEILGTKILDNAKGSLTDCPMVNVLLPLKVSSSKIPGSLTVPPENAAKVHQWMLETLMNDYKTYIAIAYFQDEWWTRLCGQIYLSISDFESAANSLKSVCERVGNEEYLEVKSD